MGWTGLIGFLESSAREDRPAAKDVEECGHVIHDGAGRPMFSRPVRAAATAAAGPNGTGAGARADSLRSMMTSDVTLGQAVARFDRSTHESDRRGYQSQRDEILKRFPREQWPGMELEDYALGLAAADTYCRWLEYKSPSLGGIGGGSARKHIVYKRRHGEGWYFPPGFRTNARRGTSCGASSYGHSSWLSVAFGDASMSWRPLPAGLR